MNKIHRVSLVAVSLIVILRLAIGWQMLYEGLWKVQTLNTPKPWTSAGYLKNSQGPLRGMFRSLNGDPDDLGWLDYETIASRWDNWHARFEKHYQLSDGQKRRLNSLLNGEQYFAAELSQLPEGVDFKKAKLEKIVSYDAQQKRLRIDGKLHMKPGEKEKLLEMAPMPPNSDDPNLNLGMEFRKAVETAYRRSLRLSFKERLAAALKGNPDRVGNERQQRIGEIQNYKSMLRSYEMKLAAAQQDFQYDHLRKTWADIQVKRSQLVGPINALDANLKEEAQKLLSLNQLAQGAVPLPWTRQRVSDLLTMAGLTLLGAMLVFGLFTRFSAMMAAFLLFSFYMAMPPLPGYPEIPGPEHSFIVNKNLIEVVALLAIAALPTGTWFGLDALVKRSFSGRKARNRASKNTKTTAQPAAA